MSVAKVDDFGDHGDFVLFCLTRLSLSLESSLLLLLVLPLDSLTYSRQGIP